MVMVGSANTVRVAAVGTAPAAVCVVVTPDDWLDWTPAVVLVTLKITVQLLLAGIAIPVNVRAVAPAVKEDGLAAQVPVTLPPAALMLASVSVNVPPLSAMPLLLDIVKVKVEVAPAGMVVGLNASEMVGKLSAVTVRLTEAAAVPAAGVCVVVTPEAALGCVPTVLLVTVRMTVQLPLAGMVIPLKLSAVVPAVKLFVSPHVPLTAPAVALMFVSVSVNWPPVRFTELLLVKVKVSVEVPKA